MQSRMDFAAEGFSKLSLAVTSSEAFEREYMGVMMIVSVVRTCLSRKRDRLIQGRYKYPFQVEGCGGKARWDG